MTEEEIKQLAEAAKNGDNEALERLTALADGGNALAQDELGGYYFRIIYDGKKISKEFSDLSFKYFSLAAEQGLPEAQYSLAKFYSGLHGAVRADYRKYIEFIEKSAEQGYAAAQLELAHVYSNNKYRYTYFCLKEQSQNLHIGSESRKLFANLATIMDKEGEEYVLTHGYGQNYEKAVFWYKKAAAQGNAGAQYYLAECYEKGQGVKPDYAVALELYNKSAQKNYRYAIAKLGLIYYFGELGVTVSYKKAVEYFKIIADVNDYTAQYFLGICYLKGQGVERDYGLAVEWLKKSAIDNQYHRAREKLGDCYYYGEGVERDYEQAAYWYKLAEAQGNTEARLKLIYLEGLGYSNDLTYVERAAKDGFEDAQIKLNEIKENERKQSLINLADAERKFSIANAGTPHDVFISWNHLDKQFKDSLVEGIEGGFSKNKKIYTHYRAWESDRDAEGDIEECIHDAIEQSKFFVLILSKNSVQSEWVKKEVEFALKKVDSGEWKKSNIIVICLNSLGFDAGRYLSKIQSDDDNIFAEIAGYAANFDDMFIKSHNAKTAKSKTVESVCQRINNGLEAETVKKYVKSQTDGINSFEFTLKGQIIGGVGETFVNAIMPMDGGYISRNLHGVNGEEVTSEEVMQSGKSLFITGDGGVGKSLYISDLIKRNFSKNANFFIRVNLLNYVNSLDGSFTLTDILNAEINGANGTDGYKPLGSYIRARGKGKGNRMVIVLDGLDEISKENCDKLINLTAEYLKKYPYDRFIITCRTSARFNDFNEAFSGELSLYELKGLTESEQSLLYDNILKANEKFKISAVTETGARLKNEFFVRLESLSDDIKKNPFLLSNLIFIYLRTNGDNFPQTGYEIISRSVGIFLECSEKSKPTFNDAPFKEYLSGNKLDKMLGYIACQKVLNNSGCNLEQLICRYLSINGAENPEETGKAIYDYLCKRSIVTSDKITHDIFTSFFACGYLYNIIYKKTSTEKIDEDFIEFSDEEYFNKQLKNGGFFVRGDGACPEVAAELIMKLDYEIHAINTAAEMNEKHLSFAAFDKTLKKALTEKGFSQTAINAVEALAYKKNGLFYDRFVRGYIN